MRNKILTVGATLAALAMLDMAPAEAQRVSADIRIGGRGPVAGTIHVGDRYGRWDRRVVRRGPYRGTVVRRDFPRRIVVETFPGKSYRRNLRRAQIVTAYYDHDCGLFFDRPFRGLREVEVYRYNGHYYPMNDRLDRDRLRRGGDRDRDRDRDRRYDRDRRDGRDRGYDDYDNGRWEHEH